MATKQRIDLDVVVKNSQRIDALERSLGRTSNSALSLGKAAKIAAGAIAAIGVGAALRSLVRVGSQVESLGLRFKFLFGSAEEGAKAFDTLTEFAGRVPFSLEEISAASGNLAVVADDAAELNDILEITGNVAAVSGLDFRTAGEQIQRAFAGGIASADIFRERGVRSLLGFKEGATVTAEETRAAFFRVFGKGGQFGAATDEFANTLEGTISMLQDKLFKFQDVASREFFDELKDQLGDLNQFFEDNQETIDRFATEVGKNLGKAVIGTGKAVIFLKDNLDAVKIALVAILTLKLVFAFNSIAQAVGIATGAFRALLPILITTGKVARRHPLILAGTLAAIYLLGDSIDELSEKLFGNADALDDAGKNLNDYNSDIDENTRLQNLNNHIISGTIALYDDYTTEAIKNANAIKYQNEQIEKTGISLEKLKGADRSFASKIMNIGESDMERLTRQRREDLDRIAKMENINENTRAELKLKVNEEYFRKLNEMDKKRAQENKRRQEENIRLIRQGKIQEVEIEKMTQEQKGEMVREAGRSILEQLATQNRTAFNAFKAVRIEEAIIESKSAIQSAFAKGMAAGGPIGAFLFAGAAAAYTAAQINAIRATQYQGREMGGPVNPGQTFLVGESGPELFRPATSGFIDPDVSGFGVGQGATINFNITTVDAIYFDELLATRQELIISLVNRGLTERGRARLV